MKIAFCPDRPLRPDQIQNNSK